MQSSNAVHGEPGRHLIGGEQVVAERSFLDAIGVNLAVGHDEAADLAARQAAGIERIEERTFGVVAQAMVPMSPFAVEMVDSIWLRSMKVGGRPPAPAVYVPLAERVLPVSTVARPVRFSRPSGTLLVPEPLSPA